MFVFFTAFFLASCSCEHLHLPKLTKKLVPRQGYANDSALHRISAALLNNVTNQMQNPAPLEHQPQDVPAVNRLKRENQRRTTVPHASTRPHSPNALPQKQDASRQDQQPSKKKKAIGTGYLVMFVAAGLICATMVVGYYAKKHATTTADQAHKVTTRAAQTPQKTAAPVQPYVMTCLKEPSVEQAVAHRPLGPHGSQPLFNLALRHAAARQGAFTQSPQAAATTPGTQEEFPVGCAESFSENEGFHVYNTKSIALHDLVRSPAKRRSLTKLIRVYSKEVPPLPGSAENVADLKANDDKKPHEAATKRVKTTGFTDSNPRLFNPKSPASQSLRLASDLNLAPESNPSPKPRKHKKRRESRSTTSLAKEEQGGRKGAKSPRAKRQGGFYKAAHEQ